MNFQDPSGLTLAIVFLVPGFISIKVWDLLVPSERRELTASSLEVFGYSSLTFAVLIGPLLALDVLGSWSNANPVRGYLLMLGVLFVAPALWPILLWRLRTSALLRGLVVHPTPKPWDYVFSRGEGYWIILHMKDGRRIGGRYETDSFASSFPNEEQLYLQEVWELNEKGSFVRKIERTRGIVVSSSDLYAIELFSGDDGHERGEESGEGRKADSAAWVSAGEEGLPAVERVDDRLESADGGVGRARHTSSGHIHAILQFLREWIERLTPRW